MKTIATGAVLMMLAVPTWAADAEKQTNDQANSNDPIVLSEAEMDGVTAGFSNYPFGYGLSYSTFDARSSTKFEAQVYILSKDEP